jgi:GT2 family glycosyltransferase
MINSVLTKNPKVLVGCPTYEGFSYCLDRFIGRIKELTYTNYDFLIVDNSEGNDYYNKIKDKGINIIKAPRFKDMFETVAHSRNIIINFALNNNYDYLLNLDQDVMPPVNIIEELIGCDKDIVSGVYHGLFRTSTGMKKLPVAYADISKEEFEEMQKISPLPPFIRSHEDIRRNLTQEEVSKDRILEVRIPSNGCMLIKRNVLQNKEIRYGMIDMANKVGKTTDEILFCEKAKEQGFKLYIYTKIRCKHIFPDKTL